ncbi:MAG TPA: hypothetical protein VN921_05500 [Chthoniobacterales bacterium]|nr:hypothetical protein [Chthoniobacterales bacterium]
MPAKSARPLNVFIGCPGDMAAERAELLKLRDHFDELGYPVRFLTWKNATPGAGDPQKVIFDNYPVASWDVFVGLLWTRFGVPSGIHDPLSHEILTGTQAEFVRAYDALVASGGHRPQVLLYRCVRDLPVDVDVDQLVGVRRFFKQTETGAHRPALSQTFKTADELARRVVQDIVKVAERLRGLAKKSTILVSASTTRRKKVIDWTQADARYRQHLVDANRIVRFHTAEARRPVEIELENVFIKLRTQNRSETRWDYVPDHIRRLIAAAEGTPNLQDNLILESHGVLIDPKTLSVSLRPSSTRLNTRRDKASLIRFEFWRRS